MASAGEDTSRPKHRKVLVIVAVSVLTVVALGAAALVSIADDEDDPPAPPPRAAVLESAAAWFDAWEADDREAMATLAGVEGEAKVAMLAQLAAFRDGLGGLEAAGGSLQVTPGEPVIALDGATVPFEAQVTLGGIGVWQFHSAVAVARAPSTGATERARARVRWQPTWDPTVLHPALTPGRRLDLSVSWPQRGALVLGDGRPAAGRVAASLLGRVAAATPEQAAALGAPYRAGQSIGVSGLQASQERRLAGTPTAELRVLEGDHVVQALIRFDGQPSAPATVTIDPRLQTIAQEVLETAPEGKLAAMVAIRPSTGDVLVEANRPSGGFDRALNGRYPPGSTFKVVTTLALLTKGIGLDESVPCPAEAVIGGRRFVNAEGEVLGNIPFRQAFAHSCNTAFVQLAQRLTPDELHAAAVGVGFDRDPGIGVPAATSSMPVPSGPVDLAASAIGQGRILASPLQMATVAASVAAGGYRPPRLVDSGPPAPVTPFAPGVADATATLMRLVVTEGTGKAARLPAPVVGGKTGTAEFGTELPLHTHAWFIAFRGDLAIAVLVDDGGFGGQVAAPIAAAFLRRAG